MRKKFASTLLNLGILVGQSGENIANNVCERGLQWYSKRRISIDSMLLTVSKMAYKAALIVSVTLAFLSFSRSSSGGTTVSLYRP
jgi:hypothetical protein